MTENQLNPTQLRIQAMLKKHPEFRYKLDTEILAQEKKQSEPNAMKVFVATRLIMTVNDYNLYAACIFDSPVFGESRSEATFPLPQDEKLDVSQNRVIRWVLQNVDRSEPIRIYSSLYIDAPLDFADLKVFYLADNENPAVPLLNQYLRDVHMY